MKYLIHNMNEHSISGLGVTMQNESTLRRYLGHIMLTFEAKNDSEAIDRLNEFEKHNGYLNFVKGVNA